LEEQAEKGNEFLDFGFECELPLAEGLFAVDANEVEAG
tara:strand:+ start:186 stop:299 length:114 start_codon:yes stop_codon:yes gene_type:complete